MICPRYSSHTIQTSVRNLTSNRLTLAVRNIDCWDWSNTGNPSKITGRVVGPGETMNYRLERASDYRYDMGFSLPAGNGRKLSGTVNVRSLSQGRCNTFDLGEDPKKTKSTIPFNQWPDGLNVDNLITVYSDGTNLYSRSCSSSTVTNEFW